MCLFSDWLVQWKDWCCEEKAGGGVCLLFRPSLSVCVWKREGVCVCVCVCEWGGVRVWTLSRDKESQGWWDGGGSASLRGLIVSSICQHKGLFYFCNDDDKEDGDVCKFARGVRVSGRHKELWGVTPGVWRETHAEHSPTNTHQR